MCTMHISTLHVNCYGHILTLHKLRQTNNIVSVNRTTAKPGVTQNYTLELESNLTKFFEWNLYVGIHQFVALDSGDHFSARQQQQQVVWDRRQTDGRTPRDGMLREKNIFLDHWENEIPARCHADSTAAKNHTCCLEPVCDVRMILTKLVTVIVVIRHIFHLELFRIRSVVSPPRAIKNFWENALIEGDQIRNRKLPTDAHKFWAFRKNRTIDSPSRIKRMGKIPNFDDFVGSDPSFMHRWAKNLAEGSDFRSALPRHILRISVQRVASSGRKNPFFNQWVKEVTAYCPAVSLPVIISKPTA